jgi:hypothetical protein
MMTKLGIWGLFDRKGAFIYTVSWVFEPKTPDITYDQKITII